MQHIADIVELRVVGVMPDGVNGGAVGGALELAEYLRRSVADRFAEFLHPAGKSARK